MYIDVHAHQGTGATFFDFEGDTTGFATTENTIDRQEQHNNELSTPIV